MTASKSSRARNARNGAPAGAPRAGAAVKSGPANRNSTANRNGGNRGGTVTRDTDRARAAGTRNGAAGRGAREQVLRPEDDADQGGPALWLQLTTFVLALAGLGVSIYLTVAHFTDKPLAGCSESGLVNCTKVTTSAQSYVFHIPVAVLGLAFFLFAAAIMSPWAWRTGRREIHLLRMASLVVGIGFVLYLLYAELFIIGSICLYCTSVHAITFLLFVLTVIAAATWGFKPGAAWKFNRAQKAG